jgi:hypothetical protein
MTLALPRRTFLTGALSLIAAPAIVRVSSLMPVKALPALPEGWIEIGDDDGGFIVQTEFLAAMRFQRDMISRIFRIPPDRLIPNAPLQGLGRFLSLSPILRPDPAVGCERQADLDVEVLGEEAGERGRAAG